MPAIHMVSMVHLCLVAAFLSLYACEAVVEGSHARDELHPTAIRMHFLIDTFLEIPLMIGIFATGVILSFQVEEITTAHAWLIACGTLVVFSCIFCFFRFVRTRRRLLNTEPIDHARLIAIRKQLGIFTLGVLNPALIAALGIGFWLAHKRALEAFCL
jgi:Na+/melibiose symporter-like transporter